MMKYSFGLEDAFRAIENAVVNVLGMGYRTADIASPDTPRENIVGTKEMGRLIISKLKIRFQNKINQGVEIIEMHNSCMI